MSRPDGVEFVELPPPPPSAPPPPPVGDERSPMYRVMIGCGIAGVLIALGAAVVDFGLGRHADVEDEDGPRLPPISIVSHIGPSGSGILGGHPIVVGRTP